MSQHADHTYPVAGTRKNWSPIIVTKPNTTHGANNRKDITNTCSQASGLRSSEPKTGPFTNIQPESLARTDSSTSGNTNTNVGTRLAAKTHRPSQNFSGVTSNPSGTAAQTKIHTRYKKWKNFSLKPSSGQRMQSIPAAVSWTVVRKNSAAKAP